MKLQKYLSLLLLFVIVAIVVERLCHSATEGFRLNKIASTLPFDPQWEVEPLPMAAMQEVRAALHQKYFFLGSGGQCYAFISEDRKTVLKLFKHHHMRTPPYLTRIPFSPLQTLAKHRQERFVQIFGSFKIAYESLKEETALLYMHLNKTSHLDMRLTLVDKIGIAHTIDLDTTEFALQGAATLAYPHLRHLRNTQDIEGAKESLRSMLQLIVKRSQRGVADRDPILKRNFGFIGNRAVEIDLGSFFKKEDLKKPYAYKKELFYETLKLKKWVKKHYPELLSYINEAIDALLAA